MIVKHNLNPVAVVRYMRIPLAISAAATAVAIIGRRAVEGDGLVVPFGPIGTLGGALAIFVAIRNNASYSRWWEARTLLGNVHNNSRILARQLVAATDNAIAAGTGGDASSILEYRRELVLRTASFAHLLRMQLRGVPDWEAVTGLLGKEELERLRASANPANVVLQTLAIRVKDGVRAGIVGQFDPITLEPNLTALNTWAASCERIKQTPTPRQYDYFTRVGVGLFSIVLPFGLLGVITSGKDWMLAVISVAVASFFIILERVGAVIDAPFENTINDVPFTAVCRSIERDLREQLGDTNLPPASVPVDGYLW